MIVSTIASILALLVIIVALVLALIRFGQAADRAEARLMVQEELLAELDAQGERIEGQAEIIERLNRLLVDMGEDQLLLLDKIDRQTETIEELVTEVEALTRETLVEVTDLHFELVEVPGEPGRIEIITETVPVPGEKEVVEVPGETEVIEVPADPPPEPEPDHPGRPCHEFPPDAKPARCR